ncbi:polymeric immunoglobulin receptor [Labeo rohita]|uniref:polymeric immunoglobulin receptor n=1 Tax=Labeo rohita TaxID=84645 RepID=UPI0021E2A2AB|nr:polymeric immunoglobulin receptor [Labeo rohita]
MKIIWTFTLLMIPGVVSSISVTGYSGGGVIITCRYDKNYTANAKYFCKGQKPNILQNKRCSDLIKTEEKEKWVYEGRFSLYDDTSAAVFIVTIRDLSEQDSGTYQCASDISLSKDSYTEVKLNVITGQKISTVTGYSGGNIIINYKYDNKPKEPLINICKSGADQCFKPTSTNRAAEWKHDGRFTIHDGSSAGFLRFFIKELNVNDSAEYKIMVKDSEDHRFFSKLNLNIEDADCCEKSISLSAAAGGSVNISCKYPQSHRAHVKFVCRRSGSDLCAEETSVKENRRWSAEGQIQLYDDREQQLLTGTISHVTQQHSAEYWCGVQSDQGHKSFITRVLINVTDIPKTTLPTTSSPSSSPSSSSSPLTSASSSSSSVRSSLITGVSKSTAAGWSLIIPLVLLALIITGLLLLFLFKKHQSRGGGPSSQAGAGKHDLVSDTDCNYENIKDTKKELPTNPSVSPNCVYSMVHEATGDSQILISSADDLNYTVVNFQKKADCPDSVSLRNNQDYSEYAAVNHHTA